MTLRRVALAIAVVLVALVALNASTAQAQQDVEFSGLTGMHATAAHHGALHSRLSFFDPCCNCACGFEGCTVTFQGRDCYITGGVCYVDSCI